MGRLPSCVAAVWLLGCGRIGYQALDLTGDAGPVDAGSADAASDAGGADAQVADADVGDADISDADVADAPSDAGPDCVADPCVIVLPQCGCRTGEMCQRTGATTDERGCVPEGSIAADEVCPLDAECVPGHACLAMPTGSPRCHQYCDDDTDCAPGLECASYDEGVGIGVCGSTCTLEGGCPGGATCKVVLAYDFDSANPVALPVCAAPGAAADGDPCATSIDCAAGLHCDGANCRPMCRQDGSLPCASGTCQADLAIIRLGNVEHGFCR